MTTPAPPPFDPAHPAVGSCQAWLNTGKHDGPNGQLLILTVRVPNATLTAVMSKQDGQRWIDRIQQEIDGMSSLTIAPAGAAMPPMNGQPHPGM
jgi:hypothetical protein